MKDRTKRALTWIAIAVILAPFIVYAFPQVVGASESYVVLSGSMEPAIKVGSIVVVSEATSGSIEEGDIITYKDSSWTQENPSLTTHRVVNIETEQSKAYFETKGDANEDPDPSLVSENRVVGRVMFSIPFIGYILSWAGSTIGMIILLFVPAALIIINESMKIKKELEKDE